jgi:hypothetical protein
MLESMTPRGRARCKYVDFKSGYFMGLKAKSFDIKLKADDPQV